MTCPSCELENPSSAQYCDCGYEFVRGSKPKETVPLNPSTNSGESCPKCKTQNTVNNKFCSKCGNTMAKSKAPALAGCGCLGLIGLAVLGGIVGSTDKSTSRSPSPVPSIFSAPREPEPSPRSKVSITKFSWSKGGFDTVMEGTFTIRNDNSFAVKDMRMKCDLSAKSGTALDSVEETIYEIVSANSSKTFREVNMGFVRSQTASATCEIKGVERAN